MLHSALRILLLSLGLSLGAELKVTLQPDHGLDPAHGLWVHGPLRGRGQVTLPPPLQATVSQNCDTLTPALLTMPSQPRTVVLRNYAVCSDQQLYRLMEQQLRETHLQGWAVMFPAPKDDGVVMHQRNFAIAPHPPIWYGWAFTVPNSWAMQFLAIPQAQLNSAHITIELVVTELALDFPMVGSVEYLHSAWYAFHHTKVDPLSGELEKLTVTVTPTSGDPDIYINTGPSMNATLNKTSFSHYAITPGDDSYTLNHMTVTDPYVIIVVFGADRSDYSLQLSTPSSETNIPNGAAMRFDSEGDSYRYFKVVVDNVAEVRITVTPLQGDPDLYVAVEGTSCTSPCRPSASSSIWSSAESSDTSVNHRYEEVVIASDDAHRCANPPCTFHVAVQADTAAAIYSISAQWGDTALRLSDGVPQAGIATPSSPRYFVSKVSGTHTSLSISLVMASGDAHIYVNKGRIATASSGGYIWSSTSASVSNERVLITSNDTSFCVDCDYYITVVAISSTAEFSVTAASSSSVSTLEDGSPVQEMVNKDMYEYFKLFITEESDVEISLTMQSGNADLFVSVSADNTRPNVTHFDYESEDMSDFILIRHDNMKLKACLSAQRCSIFIGVLGRMDASQFSLLVSSYPTAAGFNVLSPAAIQGDYSFEEAEFGPRLDRRPHTYQVAYVQPHHACSAISNTADLRGKAVILDRGPHDESTCPSPNVYFANKVKRAQDAGAAVVVVANDLPDIQLIRMAAVGGDHAASITIPSLFIAKATGDAIKQYLSSESVLVRLSQPAARLPMLVSGLQQESFVGHGEWKYYTIFTGADKEAITISLTVKFGDADIFVRKYIRPDSTNFDYHSENEGSDRVSIGKDHGCTKCTIYVGVRGKTDTSFSLLYNVESSTVIMRNGVPVTNQVVEPGKYKYYRAWISRREDGITIGVTGSKDVDLFFSFSTEQPTAEHYERKADGRSSCWSVDCGASIWHGDAIHVPGGDSSICGTGLPPCIAYVGVYGAGSDNSTFSITMSSSTTEAPIELSDGAIQEMSMPKAGQYHYFYFSLYKMGGNLETGVAAYAPPFSVTVTPTSGDPDLYVFYPDGEHSGPSHGDAFPDRDHYDTRSTAVSAEVIRMQPLNASNCTPCVYKFAVYSYQDRTAYTIVAALDQSSQVLDEGTPFSGKVENNETKYYRYLVQDVSQAIEVLLTPFSGNPSLYASFGKRPFGNVTQSKEPPAPQGEQRASMFSSEQPIGVESISILPSESSECALPPCELYIAIRGETYSSFSILVTEKVQRALRLVGGMPQGGVTKSGTQTNFTFPVHTFERGLTIAVNAVSGNPRVVYRKGAPPDSTHVDGTGVAGSPIVVAPDSSYCGGAHNCEEIVFISVFADSSDARYTITVKDADSVQLVQDRVPAVVNVPVDQPARMKVIVPPNASNPTLAVTTLQGEVTVSFGKDGGTIMSVVNANFVNLTEGVNFVNLTSSRSQRLSSNVTLLAQTNHSPLSHAQPGRIPLLPGQPLRSRVRAGVSERFSFGWGSFSQGHPTPVVISATVTSDDPEARIELQTDVASLGGQLFGLNAHSSALPGGVASVIMPRPPECGNGECVIHVDVLATGASKNVHIVIVAAPEDPVPTVLPLNVPIGGAVLDQGKYSDFKLLLDPRSTSDDNGALFVDVCGGMSSVWFNANKAPREGDSGTSRIVVDENDGGRWKPDSAQTFANKSHVYVSVRADGGRRGNAAADVILEIAEGRSRARMMSSPAVSFSAHGTGDGVTLTAAADAHDSPFPAKSHYMLILADKAAAADAGVDVDTWCGISRFGAVIASAPTPHFETQLYRRAGANGPSLCNEANSGCVARFRPYAVALVAVHEPTDKSSRTQRFVYPLESWTDEGGMSSFGVFCLLLFLGVLAWTLYWLAKRKMAGESIGVDKETLLAYRDDTVAACKAAGSAAMRYGRIGAERAYSFATFAYDKARGVRTGAVRRSTSSRPPRGDGTMTAPLALADSMMSPEAMAPITTPPASAVGGGYSSAPLTSPPQSTAGATPLQLPTVTPVATLAPIGSEHLGPVLSASQVDVDE